MTNPDTKAPPPEGGAETERTRKAAAAADYVPKLGGMVLYTLGPNDGQYGRLNGARMHPAFITRAHMDDVVNLQVLPDLNPVFYVGGIMRGKPGEPRRWCLRSEYEALADNERRVLS